MYEFGELLENEHADEFRFFINHWLAMVSTIRIINTTTFPFLLYGAKDQMKRTYGDGYFL